MFIFSILVVMAFCQRMFFLPLFLWKKMVKNIFVERGDFQLKAEARFIVLWNEQSHKIWSELLFAFSNLIKTSNK